jgi:hypothetical protein
MARYGHGHPRLPRLMFIFILLSFLYQTVCVQSNNRVVMVIVWTTQSANEDIISCMTGYGHT